MSGYIGNVPTPQATQTRDVFTATSGQTSFATSGYTPGFLDVFLNGVHLVNGTDYTASNGSDVVLTSGATTGDSLEVVAYTTFQVVDQSFSGNFSVDSPTFVVDAANNRVGVGTASPASQLSVGGNPPTAGAIAAVGASGGIALALSDNVNSSLYVRTASGGAVIGTDSGGNLRFATNGNTTAEERMRITDAGTVGIGTSTPSATFDVNGGFRFAQRGSLQGSQNVGTMLTPTSSLGGAELTSAGAGNAAFMTFHRPGGFATYFGLDTDNNMAVGGWSAGAGLAGFKCGALSKTSGSFRIDHPLKPDTHQLVHSFIEGPQADNIYRGRVALTDGSAVVNIDTVAGMTEGTFAALNRDIQCFTSNETGWCNVRGSVMGNILTIKAQDNTCTDTISWLVIGERQDQHMYETNWTDENGKVIVEPEKGKELGGGMATLEGDPA